MRIASGDFMHNKFIPARFTCDGEDINPSLNFFEVPEKAVSLALIVDDPDAGGGGWVHWLVWDIDPKTVVIQPDEVPVGATEGTTSSGSTGYGGPCPPQGAHRYFFTLYALDDRLDLRPTDGKEELLQAMQGHIIDQAELVGLYEKN